MTDEAPSRVTPEELLGGLSGRRASTAVYAIENTVAYLWLEARNAAVPAISEGRAAAEERAFLSALAAGRGRDAAPRVTHIERFAPAIAHLVPADPATRAEVAHRLAQKYRFRERDVPRLHAALGLGDPAVGEAYRRRHGRELASAFAARLPATERLRWWRSRIATRLEELPAFWQAFSLTLTQTVGAGILGLPIALAEAGPLPGLVLVVLLGLVNVVTATAIAETFARTGSVRWGGAYLGRVVRQYLGRAAGVVLAVTLVAFTGVILLAYYVGLSATMADVSGVAASVWAAALFAASLAFCWRGRIEATIASSLIGGAVKIAIVLVIAGIALGHVRVANLTHNGLAGQAVDAGILGLVFGAVLLAFFGHTAVAGGARVVLRLDPSGRALVRGTTAAMLVAVGVYGLWVLAVGGAVSPGRLAREQGTALVPLGEATGPAVIVAGTLFVVLAMGMAALHFSIGLQHQAEELLSAVRRRSVRRAVSLLPLVAVFALVETLLLTGRASFTATLSLIGTLTAPLLVGVFPILLLAAARRRGDYTLPSSRWMGHWSVVVVVMAIFVGAVVAHGTVIWDAPLARGAALATAAVCLAMAVVGARAGAFVPLTTIEVRRDRQSGSDRLQITSAGEPVRTRVEVRLADGSRRHEEVDGNAMLPESTTGLAVPVGGLAARQLRVWTHVVDPSGATSPLAAGARVVTGEQEEELVVRDGRASAPVDGPASTVLIDLRAGPRTVRLP